MIDSLSSQAQGTDTNSADRSFRVWSVVLVAFRQVQHLPAARCDCATACMHACAVPLSLPRTQPDAVLRLTLTQI